MTATVEKPIAVAYVRRAADCLVAVSGAGDHHRAAHDNLVDYRLGEIMGGQARGVGTVPGFCEDKPGFSSPWHYHDCEMQIGVVLDGSVEIAFADSQYYRVGKGDIYLVPGGVVHDVVHPSADYLTTEFTFPGTFATVEAPPPADEAASGAFKLSGNQARRGESSPGMLHYDYPVVAPYDRRYALQRQCRSRVEAFAPRSLRHDDEYLLLYVTRGERHVATGGTRHELGAGDLLVLPAAVDCTDAHASPDHEAIVIRLLRRAPA